MWLFSVILTLAAVSPTSTEKPSITGQLTLPDDCRTVFSLLYDKSGKLANAKRYAEAAALRQASGDIFQRCLFIGKAPRNGQYPFDGVGAYIIAADFWHLAGQLAEARSTLNVAESALRTVLRRYPETSLPYGALAELYQFQKMISDDEAGCWGVWQESDDEQSVPSAGEARILPPYPCAQRNL